MKAHAFLRPALAASLLAVSTLALSHHSSAMFDSSREVEVKGVVKVYKFENPHVNIVVTVKDEKTGTATDWFIEAASVRGLAMAGWRKSTLKAGDAVTIVGRPLRDGQPGASMVRAILADGTTLAANAGRNY
jgi:DNA/RNA endonuclease YhcR with UshA esterase domain